MDLTPIESSHIAAIGYLEADRVLLVRYKDGGVYAWHDIGPTAWRILQTPGQSIGHWLANNPRKGILISKGVMPTESVQSERDPVSVAVPGDNAAPSPGPLNVLDPEAWDCCKKAFRNWPKPDEAECRECGTHFRAELVKGTRYWRIVPLFAVHRVMR